MGAFAVSRISWGRLGMMVLLVCGAAAAETLAQEQSAGREAATGDTRDPLIEEQLDTIRDLLVELRFEEAVAGINALVARDDLSDVDRVDALVLRAEAHVASGNLAAAEEAYTAILRLRPEYVPDPDFTPQKAMSRFEEVREATVGRLVLSLTPPDADVTVDGKPVSLGPQNGLVLPAGDHVIRVERAGFDPGTSTVIVSPGTATEFELRLVPNARSVLLLTEPEGVEVRLDGVALGRTQRPRPAPGSRRRGPAQLLLENLPLGEHTFEFDKACFRSERRREFLDVDLMDISAKRFALVRLLPTRSTLIFSGGPDNARVLVDGRAVGRLPLEPVELCPGPHELEVRQGDRRLWVTRAPLAEGQDVIVSVEVRPNVVLLGTDAWPADLSRFANRFNVIAGDGPLPGGELSAAATWDRVRLDADIDLVIARRGSPRDDVAEEWFLYSPLLERVAPLEPGAAELGRPRWESPSWGFFTVDSRVGGPLRVARVDPGGPAAAAGLSTGDRIARVGGAEVRTTAQARRILAVASWNAPLELEWITADGRPRRGKLQAAASPRLYTESESPARSAVRAAWARAGAASEEETADVARANLALLYAAYGFHERAAEAWRGVRWEERSGIGRGTALYYLGRELEALGLEGEAIEAYRGASSSAGTAFDDEGPSIAPAARDRLADLGVDGRR